MKASDLKTESLLRVDATLSPQGWERVARGSLFRKSYAPKLEVRLNFRINLKNRTVCAHVTPYVEIAHEDVEKARRKISGRPLYTVNAQIQTLMGDVEAHKNWILSPGKTETVTERLIADSLAHAEPFAEPLQNLEDIIAYLEATARGKRTITQESLAIAYCLVGRLDDASHVLADEVEAVRLDPRDVASEQLPRYAELFGLPVSL